MKALVLKEYMRLECEEVPDPKPTEDEVLVQVRACGICGSDVHGMDGSSGRRQPPVIMGHEASGVIAEVGKSVTTWSKGDRVTFDSTVYCGQCWYCQQGEVNLCDHRRVLGVSCADYRQDGAFAEFVAVPHQTLYRLPDVVTFEQAAMIEPLSVAVHAVERASPAENATAIVIGAGVIGLLLVQVLRARGSKTLIAVDIDPQRLKLAQKLGADVGLLPDKCDVVQEVLQRTEGRGADASFEAVGASATVNLAIDCLRKGGTSTLVGNLSPTVEVPLQMVVTRQLSLLGTCASSGEYPACLDLIARGLIQVDPLVSTVAPLKEGAWWFRRLYDKEPGLIKVILKPS